MNILYVLPHCSTGGMPQYVLKLIEEKLNDNYIEVVEVFNHSNEYTVQRDKIKKIVKLHQLEGDDTKLLDLLSNFDVIHFQEIPESFISSSVLGQVYRKGKKHSIYVTTHNSFVDPSTIRFTADKFILVSQWSKKQFDKVFPGTCDIWDYPIKYQQYSKQSAKEYLGWDLNYKHVLHVGLFTPGKNQKELIDIARLSQYENIKFHFVGNLAINFKDYWQPLITSLPDNCIIHGEVDNPEDYYKAADLFYFPSLFELNPLAVKEALSYNLPIMLRKLDTYEDTYDKIVEYINKETAADVLKKILFGESLVDIVVIVLAHADTEYRKLLLNKCLGSIRQKVILSTNHQLEESTQQLCDYIFYTKENPLLRQEDFAKYNVLYNYWWIDSNGTKHYKTFEYEHGYAVYKLIQNGINLAKVLGYKHIAIINYDYEIGNDKIVEDCNKLINNNDLVVYEQDSSAYQGFTYSTGYFLASVDAVEPFFNKFKSIDDYYLDGEGFNILEKKFYKYCTDHNLKLNIENINSLKESAKINQEGVLLFSKSNEYDKPKVSINYLDGPTVEIKNASDQKFYVEFINLETSTVEHSGLIGNNNWIRCFKSYYINWLIKVNDESYHLDLKGKTVYITMESSAIGDTLAWVPYIDEFRKKHECLVVCSTFMNHLFIDNYPDIRFVQPGLIVENIHARYRLGIYYNETVNLNKNPVDFRKSPLQKVAADILGVDYQEIKPKIKLPERNTKRQVAIGIHSTAQAKYWNNPTGWQEVVDHLLSKGYEVILLSKENDGYMGNYHPVGVTHLVNQSLEDVIRVLRESELFIGISSGLSWLAWACEIPIYIISGFTEPYLETTTNTVRIDAPTGACRGCYNRELFDRADWNWCPDHKGTDMQFECSKLITAELVISKLQLKY